MREWWFTFGSGLAIGWFARWALVRIREECDLLDRRYEAALNRSNLPPPGSTPFDFDG